MKKVIIIIVLILACRNMSAVETDSLTLTLEGAISLARQNSPSANSARNTFISSYLNYR